MSIPTFLIFKNGAVVDSFIGAKSKEEVKKKLDAALS
jgi:thioredoxin-like negative regulator of GroEL